ncbi:AraC family transcriptional regulator [Streptacidiphilus sp. PB12-B1b]|uniref:AraC family transcriptional regulator n=1 Tax=Streptacidiphilus sp. PB12-B1b TaxID=2705012 RepID=UPI0015FDB3BB|nr:AraC family transcriptional regulator [Streptacidiphilus sp. PB12-B1b]QMU77783.1 AraC family transcriptional regulator [Streptacidiphilus sp. PB12-B1b]
MTPLLRAAGLRGLVPLVDSLGGDGAALLARFRIDPDAPDSDDALVPAVAAARVLEHAAGQLRRPDLGLLLAEQQDISVLGPLAVAVERSATIGAALACASRFLYIHSPTLSVLQVPDPRGAAGVVGLRYNASLPGLPSPPQAIDLGMGLMHRVLLRAHGGYGLRSVHLPHPVLAPSARYTDFFGADVRFDQEAALLRLPAALMSAPLDSRDSVLRDIAVDYMATHFADPGHTLTARVRGTLARAVGTAELSVEAVARWHRMHPRTLQRHLAAEGTSYEAVLDDVRRQRARQLLTETELPLSQITGMLGLSEQSALSRAARRWFGEPPSRMRARARSRS